MNKTSAARKTIANIINAEPEEIFFTSGGTESDNWVCNDAMRKRGHIITTTIEHKAVLATLENYGRKTLVPPDENGYEDKKEVIENIDSYSLDDIEAKLSILCVRNKVSFSEEEEQTPAANPMTYNVTGMEEDNVPAWIKAVLEKQKTM